RAEISSTKGVVEVQKELPIVVANPVLLHQVLCNLIENALKFMKAGVPPSIHIWAETRNQRSTDSTVKPTARLWIRDNGIGIASIHLHRIFRVFERLHSENSSYPGTGIGLALVQKAVERMNGLVGVESTPGKGSLFWIELPTA
ncbi:MAG: ATP-binding protein, partial [Verrucomicrobiota bacterium]